jgi:vanillate O-demethylase monooxygenase subunit
MTYLLNCWYLAAWEEELPAGGHLLRTIAERPLIVSRSTDGEVDVLLDRCPHRLVPLSRGLIGEDGIVCAYHGIGFDRKGVSTHNPHGPIQSALSVPSYPAVIRHRGKWVWLGDPERADPASIPDLSVIGEFPPVAQIFGYEFIAANYLLCSDNILDLSHADYLHPDSLGGGATTRAKQAIRETDSEIRVDWLAANDVAPPALEALMDEPGQPIDLKLWVRWNAPGVMLLNFGAVPAGRADLGGPDTWGIHVMVPQNAASTHYFYWNGRNRGWTPEFNAIVREAMRSAFAGEDKPMLEAQQRNLGGAEFEDLSPVLLRTDEGPVRIRRRMSKLIAAEQAEKRTS